jgi:hypothetical protein
MHATRKASRLHQCFVLLPERPGVGDWGALCAGSLVTGTGLHLSLNVHNLVGTRFYIQQDKAKKSS